MNQKKIIPLIVGIVIAWIVGIYLVGSDFNPSDPPIPRSSNNTNEWCEKNYLDAGYSSVLDCIMTEILMLERD